MKIRLTKRIIFAFFLAAILIAPLCTTPEMLAVSADSVSSLGGGRIITYDNVILFLIDINNDNNSEKAVGYPNLLPLPNPCGDVRFRHALWHLVNRSQVVSNVWNGTHIPQYTILPYPEYRHPDIKPNRLLEDLTHPYNFEEANAILDEAGYTDKNNDTWRDNPDGSDITLIFYTREDDPQRTQLASAYTYQLNAAGIKVDLRIESFSTCLEAVMTNKTHHLYAGGWSFEPEPIHLEQWMSDYYDHPDPCPNYNRLNFTEFDEAATLFNLTQNVGDGYEVQEIFNNESYTGALGVMPVCSQVLGVKRVHNVDTGLDYTTIQEAIDAPETLDGHTVLADAGTYCERVIIDKRLDLMGESRSNTIINSSGLSYAGPLVKIESDNVTMSGFTVTNAAYQGIEVADSKYCRVHDNTVCFVGDRGIVFGGGGNNKAYNNVVYNSSAYGGIEAISSDNNTIYNNLAYFNVWGIATNNGCYNRIYGNKIYYNRGTGIHIDWPSTGNIINNNDVSSNFEVGICVMNRANRTDIFGNTISGSHCGILFENSFANNISGNYIANNVVGVMLGASENNTFYHNNFIANTLQVHIQPSRFNIWDDDFPHGGNYWSDYTGVDLYSGPHQNETGGDGIGDIPYIIDTNNTDRYPLVRARYYEAVMTQVVSTESTASSNAPSLAVGSDGIIHVAWFDLTDYCGSGIDRDVFYKRFVPSTGWTTTEVVSTESTGDSYYPSLAVDLSGNVHVAWHDYTNYEESGTDADIFYKAKIAGNWTNTQVVSTESTGISLCPSLAVDQGGNIHIAWHDITNYDGCGTDWDIFYRRCEVGSGWKTIEVVSTESTRNSFAPSLDLDSTGNIHIAWFDISNYEESGTDADIFYKAKIAGNWTNTQVVSTESTEHSQGPSLAVDQAGNIHIAWYDDTNYSGCGNDSDIFYRRRVDDTGWTATEVVSKESTNDSYHPSLGVDQGGNVHVAWYDNTNYTPPGGDRDVIYKRYEFGANWTFAEVVSTESTGDSYYPSLAVDLSGNVHVAWHDYTNYAGCGSDIDIFYKYIRVHSTRYTWPMFRHDPRHTGYIESPAPSTSKTLWSYTTDAYVWSSPAVVDGKVYVGSDDNKVYCLNALTGTKIWNYTTGAYVVSSPAVVDGKVYVGSDDNKVYCLNALTGTEIWNYTTGGPVRSCPTVVDGKVYIGSYDYNVYCIDALTGTKIWNYTTGYLVRPCPVVVDGKVYIGSYDYNVYCIDAETGTKIWNYTTGSYVASSPAVAYRKVYVGSCDNNVYCLDAETGTKIWNYTTGYLVQSSPAVVDGKVYIGSDDANVYCLNAETGTKIWNYTTGDKVFSSPAVADGKVYIGSDDNKVYCLNALTGTKIWDYTTGDKVFSSPAVADGVVFVGSDDHGIYAFGEVIRVPEDYPTVQEAIDAAEGTTILVAPGVYHETVVLNKTLTIIGRPGSAPIFEGGGSGIAVTLLPGASGSTIAGIVITNWDQAIHVVDASDCTIYDNIMYLMDECGIVLEGENAANTFIYSNIFEDTNIAINLTASSTGNTIYKNIISSSDIGLKLESDGNTVYANTISNNEVGIDVSNSNNVIYHNNFIDNSVDNARSQEPINVWDNGYPSGGNFWSDHDLLDEFSGPNQDQLGSDGIADANYTVAVNNVDRYPLAEPFSPHDIGITSVVKLKTVIGQGFTLLIDLKALNYGLFDETFTITAYANTTIITTQTIPLTSRNSTIFTFGWDTSGFDKGNYTISAFATPVLDETFIDDNTLIDGWVIVAMEGDITGPNGWPDGKCDMRDVGMAARNFGKTSPPAPANCDITGPIRGVPDGKIDMRDIGLIARHFGEKDP